MMSGQPTLDVAPSWSAYFRTTGNRVAIIVPLLLLIAFLGPRNSEYALVERLMPAGLGLLCGIVLVLLMVLVPRVRVTADEVSYRTMVGLTRRRPRAELSAAVLASSFKAVNLSRHMRAGELGPIPFGEARTTV
jgi:hypothetical protein